jgi:cell division protein ZapA
MQPEKKQVRVTILGQSIPLVTTGDPDEMAALAAEVDELMTSIAGRSQNLDSTLVAVLACLHLADRVRALEGDLSSLRDHVERRNREFSARLDEVIG